MTAFNTYRTILNVCCHIYIGYSFWQFCPLLTSCSIVFVVCECIWIQYIYRMNECVQCLIVWATMSHQTILHSLSRNVCIYIQLMFNYRPKWLENVEVRRTNRMATQFLHIAYLIIFTFTTENFHLQMWHNTTHVNSSTAHDSRDST